MLFAKLGHQRCNMAAPKASGRGDAQMACGFYAPSTDAGLCVRHIGQDALAIFQKRAALVRQRDAPGGAQQQLHAQALFQPIQAPAHDRGGYAFGIRRSSQAATRSHRHKGFQLFQFIHNFGLWRPQGLRKQLHFS